MSALTPLITVGIPVFNGERYLERAIRSLQKQEYPNIDIVISDNCSTDATQNISLRLAAEDRRIRYYRNNINIGAVRNFVKVFELSCGEYFMWAAYDDLWDPHCLSLLVEELINWPEAGLAHSGIALIDESEQLLSVEAFPTDDNPNCWSCIELATKCVRPARGTPKLNYAMYGLFRSSVLRLAIKYVCDGAMWDRLFVILVAMIAPFRYRREPLYHRTLQDTRADERYLDDTYALQVRTGIGWRYRVTLNLSKVLISCPSIPLWRKFLIPLLVWSFAKNQWKKIISAPKKRRHVQKFRTTGVFKKKKYRDSVKDFYRKE